MAVAFVLLGRDAGAQGQDLGHRLPGGVGLDAGSQNEQGLYAGTRFAWFSSDRVHDRNGDTVPIEQLDIDAYAAIFGITGSLKVDAFYLSAAVAVPAAKRSINSERPDVSVDRLGLGDIYVEPLKLGLRSSRADAVASYSFYAPTSQGASSMIGRPQWSHQVSAGGTVFLDDQRGWRITILASYLHNLQKQGIAITRGDTVQLQGGAGGRFFGLIDLGVVGYALWQVTDDTGADLPAQLRGARERAFGLGPELDVAIRPLRSRLFARFEWDLDGTSRPVGSILVLGLSVIAWE
ncbi:MAG: hypothetical protein HOV81_08125 [Kofleriaceae bacterium]|nr:hypothetical protein [Kofleriaceae bacterium]